jgi:hypothetical protein
MNPRRAAAIGLFFAIDAFVFVIAAPVLGYHVDYAGGTMLLALGAAMAIMAYVLIAGQSRS